jgi:pantoate--beta-alanine ligase
VDIVTLPADIAAWSKAIRKTGSSIGLVPTMGALHRGHLSLVAEARRRTDAAVMSVFVNPTQFGPGEDYGKYPRLFDADCAMAREAGCAALFAPNAADMYPPEYKTFVEVEGLGGALCGRTRPIHFRGVATVVLKLLNLVRPDEAFFGQKDAQQAIVLKRMVCDLNVPATVRVCPTVREEDGLALSSRNAYLTPAERAAAPLINKGLSAGVALYEAGERGTRALIAAAEKIMTASPLLVPEYLSVVDIVSLQPLDSLSAPALMAVACRAVESKTRLIDNQVLGGSL